MAEYCRFDGTKLGPVELPVGTDGYAPPEAYVRKCTKCGMVFRAY